MNTKLLRAVKAAILAEPKRLDMSIPLTTELHIALSPCGTSGCIAGWSLVLAKRKGREPMKSVADDILEAIEGDRLINSWSCIGSKARRLLGLTKPQAVRLFHEDNWPEPFHREFSDARWGTREMASICARRIDHFIRTKGRE